MACLTLFATFQKVEVAIAVCQVCINFLMLTKDVGGCFLDPIVIQIECVYLFSFEVTIANIKILSLPCENQLKIIFFFEGW